MKKYFLYIFFLFLSANAYSQLPVSIDSVKQFTLFEKNFIWQIGNEVAAKSNIRIHNGKEWWFYFFCFLAALFGLFKLFYSKYLSTLFKVFFNSSLKQSQLTDQLQQAKLPSLFLNIFFCLTGGLFIYLLITQYNTVALKMNWLYLAMCILLVATIYTVKTLVLKFSGAVSGLHEQANAYIFIIFLLNKVVGILLLPLSMLIVFSNTNIQSAFIWIGIFAIALLLLLRYYRSYAILQNKIKVSQLHFALFIFGTEIVPLLMIYKTAMIFLSKNL